MAENTENMHVSGFEHRKQFLAVLPTELLLMIMEFLCPPKAYKRDPVRQAALSSLSRVCRRLYWIATPLLYISFRDMVKPDRRHADHCQSQAEKDRTYAKFAAFANAIATNEALARHVKYLIISTSPPPGPRRVCFPGPLPCDGDCPLLSYLSGLPRSQTSPRYDWEEEALCRCHILEHILHRTRGIRKLEIFFPDAAVLHCYASFMGLGGSPQHRLVLSHLTVLQLSGTHGIFDGRAYSNILDARMAPNLKFLGLRNCRIPDPVWTAPPFSKLTWIHLQNLTPGRNQLLFLEFLGLAPNLRRLCVERLGCRRGAECRPNNIQRRWQLAMYPALLSIRRHCPHLEDLTWEMAPPLIRRPRFWWELDLASRPPGVDASTLRGALKNVRNLTIAIHEVAGWMKRYRSSMTSSESSSPFVEVVPRYFPEQVEILGLWGTEQCYKDNSTALLTYLVEAAEAGLLTRIVEIQLCFPRLGEDYAANESPWLQGRLADLVEKGKLCFEVVHQEPRYTTHYEKPRREGGRE